MANPVRIYIASDFHAAEKAWRKFLNAIKLNVYKADIALIAGDFTGKAIVPIVKNGGAYSAELFGVHRRAGSAEELGTSRARHRRRRLLLGGDVCGRHRAARDRPGAPATSCCTG